MRTREDIESYLLRMGAPYEEIADGMWLVHDESAKLDTIVIRASGPVIVFRAKVMSIPENRREELYRMLLELNAREMLHSAYGIEENAVVLTAALETENLDFNEFQAAIDDMTLALTNHIDRLAKFRKAA